MRLKSVTVEGPPALMRALRTTVRDHVRTTSPYYHDMLRLVAGRPLAAGGRPGMVEVTFELPRVMPRRDVRDKVFSVVAQLAMEQNMMQQTREVQILYKDGRGTVVEL